MAAGFSIETNDGRADGRGAPQGARMQAICGYVESRSDEALKFDQLAAHADYRRTRP
jgi:hypothetical protein